MPDHMERLSPQCAQPMPCVHKLNDRMTALATDLGQPFAFDLLQAVRAGGGTPNDLLALLARLTAISVQFCFRQEDHEAALSTLNIETALLLKTDR